jgi:hypothetical protein
MNIRDDICLSLYMPTFARGAEVQQNPIRYRNLLGEAQKALAEQGVRSAEANRMLEPARRYLEDTSFWQHQHGGLALFLSPRMFKLYRLPLRFEELVLVEKRFHLKPLLRVFNSAEKFYLLAISQNDVRFFQGTAEGLRRLAPEGLPAGMKEALKYDDIEKQLQFHTRTASGHQGERGAMFHGTGEWKDETKTHIFRYLRKVDQALHPVLREESAPLIFAGVHSLYTIYREANTYQHLLRNVVDGNPDHMDEHKLHERALPIAQEQTDKLIVRDTRRFSAYRGTDTVSSDLRQILPAAYGGRVGVLFVSDDDNMWGAFDPENIAVHLHGNRSNNDVDLLDQAAVYTLANNGIVYTLDRQDVPGDSPVSAIYRY